MRKKKKEITEKEVQTIAKPKMVAVLLIQQESTSQYNYEQYRPETKTFLAAFALQKNKGFSRYIFSTIDTKITYTCLKSFLIMHTMCLL